MTKREPIYADAHEITTTEDLKPLKGMTLMSAVWYPDSKQVGMTFRRGDEAQGIMFYLESGRVSLSERITIPDEVQDAWKDEN